MNAVPIDSLIFQPEPWMNEAVCASVMNDDVWFPVKGGSALRAKKICAGCPVVAACLTYALDNAEPAGIWGGLSERERRRLKAHRGNHVCPTCSRRYASRHGLTCHIATHAGERHFCPEYACSRSFTTAHGRAMHQRRVHEGFDPMASRHTDGARGAA